MQRTVLIIGGPTNEVRDLKGSLGSNLDEMIVHTENSLDTILAKGRLPNDFEIQWDVIVLMTLRESSEKLEKDISVFFKLMRTIHFHGPILCFTRNEMQKRIIRENNTFVTFLSRTWEISDCINKIGSPHAHEL